LEPVSPTMAGAPSVGQPPKPPEPIVLVSQRSLPSVVSENLGVWSSAPSGTTSKRACPLVAVGVPDRMARALPQGKKPSIAATITRDTYPDQRTTSMRDSTRAMGPSREEGASKLARRGEGNESRRDLRAGRVAYTRTNAFGKFPCNHWKFGRKTGAAAMAS